MKHNQQEYIAVKIAQDCLDDLKMSASIDFKDIPDHIMKIKPDLDIQSPMMNEYLIGCNTFVGYLKTRQAFKFHPVLVHELTSQTSFDFTMNDLHLPYNDMYFDIQSSHLIVDNKEIVGVYVHNSKDTSQLAIIALVKINNDQVVLLHACLDYSSQLTISELMPDIEGGYSNEQTLYKVIFSLLSYISSDKPDIKDNGKQIAFRAHRNKRQPSATRLWTVGYRYVKDYKKILGHEPTIDEIKEISNATQHNSPRRHLRAAHWHTYLYGPGKSKRKVLWVQACWVGHGNEIDTIHVKEHEHGNID